MPCKIILTCQVEKRHAKMASFKRHSSGIPVGQNIAEQYEFEFESILNNEVARAIFLEHVKAELNLENTDFVIITACLF